jgi:hypothetical protein
MANNTSHLSELGDLDEVMDTLQAIIDSRRSVSGRVSADAMLTMRLLERAKLAIEAVSNSICDE